jgi:hypothetical protein
MSQRMPQHFLTISLLAASIAFPMWNAPAFAHHSTAAYRDDEITLRGTVADYDWGNPHVVVTWDVKDDSGKVVRWTGELASVTSLLADGMTKNSLKPGDEVVMNVRPAKSGSPNCVISQIRLADGTMVLRRSRQAGGTAEERAARAAAQKEEKGKPAPDGHN